MEKVLGGVVRIETESANGGAVGSGWIFESDLSSGAGLVLTNQHVIDGAKQVFIVVNDDTSYRATLRGQDAVRDLAVLEFCCDRSSTVLDLGAQGDLSQGSEILAIGYALGISGSATVTRGIVSAFRDDPESNRSLLQIDAAVNSGNSGGPLLDLNGRVVGVNTSVIRESPGSESVEGFAFAVSVDTVRQALPELRGVGYASNPGSTGSSFGVTGKSGAITHNPNNDLIETVFTGVRLLDGQIEAEFANPFRESRGSWSHGFQFRGGDSNAAHSVGITSDRQWFHRLDGGGEGADLIAASGEAIGINTAVPGTNFLRVVILGDQGWLFVNGDFVARLDLSEAPAASEVEVEANIFIGDGLTGESTDYNSLTVTPWSKLLVMADDTLVKVPGLIAETDITKATVDFYAEATFLNPVVDSNENWSYGFLYRDSDVEKGYATVVRSDGFYYHYRFRGPDESRQQQKAEAVTVQANFDIAQGARNKVGLLAIGGISWLFVNDVLVDSLGVAAHVESGAASTIAGLFANDAPVGTETSYIGLKAWSPAP